MKALFYTVPVGSIIRFNGCRAEKLSETHVKFLTDSDGVAIDYSNPLMKRYENTTCESIGGTVVEVLEEPKAGATQPTFNTDLWRWEIGGEYIGPERALQILGLAFYSHLQTLAEAAGYTGIIAMLEAKQRAAWSR